MKKQLTPEEFVKLAREVPRDERVPYAFETRIMAHLSPVAQDVLSLWTRALWKAVVPCVGVMMIAVAVSFATPEDPSADIETDLDNAVLTAPEPAFDLNA